MKFYFAPMEGITLYPLRNVHRELFGDGIERYYTPFLTASQNYHFKNREKRDVLPEKNVGFDNYSEQIVPQIMAGEAEPFLWAAAQMKKLGYNEVNINLGCPAPTVVNRHKGAGMLEEPERLEKFLYGIFEGIQNNSEVVVTGRHGDRARVALRGRSITLNPDDSLSSEIALNSDDSPSPAIALYPGESLYPKISLKTRLGMSDPSEAERLMEIYARYPLKELIIHARVREDYYKGRARTEDFVRAVKVYRECGGKADICYNGDINTPDDYREILKLPGDLRPDLAAEPARDKDITAQDAAEKACISSIMIGRGLLSDPSLVRRIKGGENLKADELKIYLERLYEEYEKFIPEDRNVIFKMLEHWAFLQVHFEGCERVLKAIRKSRSKGEYRAAVNNIFANCEYITDSSC